MDNTAFTQTISAFGAEAEITLKLTGETPQSSREQADPAEAYVEIKVNGMTARTLTVEMPRAELDALGKADSPEVYQLGRELEDKHHRWAAIGDEWYDAPDMMDRFIVTARHQLAGEG